MLQKQLITVLIALSVPVSGMLAGTSFKDSSAAWALGNKAIAQADYNAGSNAGGSSSDAGTSADSQPADSKSNSGAGAMGAGDSGSSGTGSGSENTTNVEGSSPGAASGSATGSATGSSTGPAGAADSSLDSMWSEAAAPPSKSKSKKRSKSKTKTPKADETAGANAGGSSDNTMPSSITPYSSTPSSITPSGSTVLPSDFGAYPAATSSSSPVSPAPTAAAVSTPAPVTTDDTARPTESSVAPTSPTTPAATVQDAPSKALSTPVTTTPATSNPVTTEPSTTHQAIGTSTTAGTSKFDIRPEDNLRAAPLCATRTFFQSELIRTVSWPGVGPFKGDSDPNDLADPQNNKLTLQTTGDKLTSAELFLMHQPGNPQGFINLQMVMDFMLEALGTRDKKISDFNGFLEKNKDKLIRKLATEEKPLTTTNGPYRISIAASGKSHETNYLILVKNKNTIDELSQNQSQSTSPDEKVKSGDDSAAPTKVKPDYIASTDIPPIKKQPEINKTKTPAKVNPPAVVPVETSKSNGDSLKQEFADTLTGWQTIKKAAVKTRDMSELPKLLSGKALARQTNAITWLTSVKKYYELTPKGVVVDHYQLISDSPKRYAVFAKVVEFSRLLDEGTNRLNKESEDQYNVNYTLEKSGDHWTIYDSQVIPSNGATGNQTKSPAKAKH